MQTRKIAPARSDRTANPPRKGRAPHKSRPRVVDPRWVLVTTQSGRENWARQNVEKQDMRTFMPRIEITHKGKLVVMFPGYLFVQDSPNLHRLRGTFGVIGLVPSNHRIEYVPRRHMQVLFNMVNEEQYLALPPPVVLPKLRKNNRVKILTGSFQSWLGSYIRETKDGLHEVAIEFMGQIVKARFGREWLELIE